MRQKYAAVGSGRFLISSGGTLTGDWGKKRRKYIFFLDLGVYTRGALDSRCSRLAVL